MLILRLSQLDSKYVENVVDIIKNEEPYKNWLTKEMLFLIIYLMKDVEKMSQPKIIKYIIAKIANLKQQIAE